MSDTARILLPHEKLSFRTEVKALQRIQTVARELGGEKHLPPFLLEFEPGKLFQPEFLASEMLKMWVEEAKLHGIAPGEMVMTLAMEDGEVCYAIYRAGRPRILLKAGLFEEIGGKVQAQMMGELPPKFWEILDYVQEGMHLAFFLPEKVRNYPLKRLFTSAFVGDMIANGLKMSANLYGVEPTDLEFVFGHKSGMLVLAVLVAKDGKNYLPVNEPLHLAMYRFVDTPKVEAIVDSYR